ncbi:hypothetical protein K3495_g5850 [Podosphaera aphanis]|nr:hypothetical protein K3495_g5850 [Podosphaera aphanis]
MLRPATPLTILLLGAFGLLVLSIISTPIVRIIPLASFAGVDFGVFGFCKADSCSPIELGYDTSKLFNDAQSSTFNLPSSTRATLSTILIVHPIAAFLVLTMLILAASAHFHTPSHSPRYLLGIFILSILTFIASLLSFLIDVLLFVPHMEWGSYLVLGATVLIAASGIISCAMRRTLVSRKARKKRIAENAEMNGANFYNRQGPRSTLVPMATGALATGGLSEGKPAFATFDSSKKVNNIETTSDERIPLTRRTNTQGSVKGQVTAVNDINTSPQRMDDFPFRNQANNLSPALPLSQNVNNSQRSTENSVTRQFLDSRANVSSPSAQGMPQEGFPGPGRGNIMPVPGGFAPGHGDFAPGRGGFVPGRGGFVPGRGGFAPGRGGFAPGRGGFAPGRGGFAPGRGGGFAPGRGGFAPGRGGFAPGRGGLVPGRGGSAPGRGGFVPGRGGFLPGRGGFEPTRGDFQASRGNYQGPLRGVAMTERMQGGDIDSSGYGAQLTKLYDEMSQPSAAQPSYDVYSPTSPTEYSTYNPNISDQSLPRAESPPMIDFGGLTDEHKINEKSDALPGSYAESDLPEKQRLNEGDFPGVTGLQFQKLPQEATVLSESSNYNIENPLDSPQSPWETNRSPPTSNSSIKAPDVMPKSAANGYGRIPTRDNYSPVSDYHPIRQTITPAPLAPRPTKPIVGIETRFGLTSDAYYDEVGTGPRSPADSDISNFTSVSQRGINPRWNDGGGYTGPRQMIPQRNPAQQKKDMLFNGNPDFALPPMKGIRGMGT